LGAAQFGRAAPRRGVPARAGPIGGAAAKKTDRAHARRERGRGLEEEPAGRGGSARRRGDWSIGTHGEE